MSNIAFEQIIKNLEENQSNYSVKCDYGTTPCHCNEDYCRCTRITNAKVNSMDIKSVIDFYLIDRVSKRYKKVEISKLDNYVIDRLFRAKRLYETSLWEVSVKEGYYGDEIDGCRISDEKIIKSIVADLKTLSEMNDQEKILFILKEEYGFILPKLKSLKDCEIISLPLSVINLPQESYGRKISKQDLSLYKDYNLPRAVCTQESNGEYFVVDGYHRILQAQQDKLENVDVIVLSQSVY